LLRANGRVTGVRVRTQAGERDVHGAIVVGTDGRTSLVRARAGLEELRAPQSFDVVWCKVPLPDTLRSPPTARAYLGGGHLLLTFPAPDGRLQIGWIIAKGSFGDLRRRGIDAWLRELERHVSADLAAHLAASRDAITQPFLLDVVCDRLERWTAPGLLLLGDAAHPMSPIGAQGINIALRDAVVAANHLVPVLARGGGPEELDAAAARVADERMPEVVAVQAQQQEPPRVLFAGGWRATAALAVLLVLARIGILPRLARPFIRRFTVGVTDVRLRV
jgi:2-polyprenyl-6-methoxyphenol hydroxylase-like FAD-dependent oxidoreductase